MANKKITLLDSTQTDELYPATLTSQVFDDNGVNVETLLDNLKTLVLSKTFSSLPQTITNTGITSSMVVVNSVLSNPSAQTGDWTITTSNGSLTIAGTISGSTTLTLYLSES